MYKAHPGCSSRPGTLCTRLHVVLPEVSLLEIRQAEFLVLVRFVNPRQKAFALLLLREVQEELDDAGAVYMCLPALHYGVEVAPPSTEFLVGT
jgi:hypothetical protein